MIMPLTNEQNKKISTTQEEPGDDTAYTELLYLKYKSFLFYKAGAYTKDLCAQEDIVQDAVLRLLQHIPKLRSLEPAALITYLALTVRSAALNYLSAERRDNLNADPLPDDYEMSKHIHCDTQISLEESLILSQRDNELRSAISRLSKRDQFLLTGKYFLELNNHELAEMLGVTTNGLRVLLHRAKNRMLKELMRGDILHG